MKNNSGVTLVELAIVLVIMMMIAVFAIHSGRKVLNEADATELLTDYTAMRKGVSSILVQKNMDDTFEIKQGEHYDEGFSPATGFASAYGTNVLGNQTEWFIVYGKEDASKYKNSNVKEKLGLDGINHTYIVNYETGDVELYRPQTVDGTTVRTYDEVRALANNS